MIAVGLRCATPPTGRNGAARVSTVCVPVASTSFDLEVIAETHARSGHGRCIVDVPRHVGVDVERESSRPDEFVTLMPG